MNEQRLFLMKLEKLKQGTRSLKLFLDKLKFQTDNSSKFPLPTRIRLSHLGKTKRFCSKPWKMTIIVTPIRIFA
ncbi:hypothetical protein [Streptococcus phage 107]|nr:hypothetical protein [Streptococcus phage 107]